MNANLRVAVQSSRAAFDAAVHDFFAAVQPQGEPT